MLINKDLKTKEKCYDFKVVTMHVEPTTSQKWIIQDFFIPDEGEIIKEIDIFSHSLVLYFSKEGTVYMKIVELNNKNDSHKINLGPEYQAGTSIAPGLNENLSSNTFRFHVDTPYIFNQVFDYNFQSKKCDK